MSALRALLRRFSRLATTDDQAEQGDAAEGIVVAPDAPARRLLALAETEALDAFRRAGLPDTPGLFVWDRDEADWRLLPTSIGPRDRWTQVLQHPPEAGWRYASLSQMARRQRPEDPVIALAADLLEQVSVSRARLDGGGGGDAANRHDLEVAFELTMTWMRLCEAVTPATPPPVAAKSPAGKKTAARPRKRGAA